jgi:hypothetical protein
MAVSMAPPMRAFCAARSMNGMAMSQMPLHEKRIALRFNRISLQCISKGISQSFTRW